MEVKACQQLRVWGSTQLGPQAQTHLSCWTPSPISGCVSFIILILCWQQGTARECRSREMLTLGGCSNPAFGLSASQHTQSSYWLSLTGLCGAHPVCPPCGRRQDPLALPELSHASHPRPPRLRTLAGQDPHWAGSTLDRIHAGQDTGWTGSTLGIHILLLCLVNCFALTEDSSP